MALPKQRHTRHRRDRARKQYDVQPINLQKCAKCGASVLPHRACKACGAYKGRSVAKKEPVLARSAKSSEKKG